MATENIRDLRWKLEWVVRRLSETGGVIIVDRDGETELAVLVAKVDYERLQERAGDVDAGQADAAD